METYARSATSRSDTRVTAITAVVAAMLLTLAGAGLASASDESVDPAEELLRLRAELAAVGAERDALLEATEERTTRYERSSAAQQRIIDIIDDPTAVGSQEEVLDLLSDLAAPGAVMDDVAFGAVAWRDAWRGTLYGAQAHIRTWATWMAQDGSIGGSLWTWCGTSIDGSPFALPGVEVSRYDEDGRMTSVLVYWPYEDAEVRRVFYSGNEACAEEPG